MVFVLLIIALRKYNEILMRWTQKESWLWSTVECKGN